MVLGYQSRARLSMALQLPLKSATHRNPMVEQRSKPGHISRNFAAKRQGTGPPSAYQIEPCALNQLPPFKMQKRVRPSLRSLSVQCQTLPHRS